MAQIIYNVIRLWMIMLDLILKTHGQNGTRQLTSSFCLFISLIKSCYQSSSIHFKEKNNIQDVFIVFFWTLGDKMDVPSDKMIILDFSHLTVGNFHRFSDLMTQSSSQKISLHVHVDICACFWHHQSQSAGAITSHSHHLQSQRDMLSMNRIKGVCQRRCVGETTLISAFQPVLPGILASIPHHPDATVIHFVRLYSKQAKYTSP